jgi:hypothetical protein
VEFVLWQTGHANMHHMEAKFGAALKKLYQKNILRHPLEICFYLGEAKVSFIDT